ncbi:hypothetical protein C8R44DRAFT_991659 [Mycena epipterygia]|nr:hypothetical protein C8R44DRAFT_991659 [Mycena epipterygia]
MIKNSQASGPSLRKASSGPSYARSSRSAICPREMYSRRGHVIIQLLLCIVQYAADDITLLTEPFTKFLSSRLASYSDLRRVEIQLDKIDSADDTELSNQLGHRVELGYVDGCVKFCDNLECHILYPKKDLHHCAVHVYILLLARMPNSRLTVRRTSQSLQIFGTSKFIGPSVYNVTSIRQAGDTLSIRDKAFLRSLVHVDYVRSRHQVFEMRAEFMVASGGGTHSFHTEFNYALGAVQLNVHPCADILPCLHSAAARIQWDGTQRWAHAPGRRGRAGMRCWLLPAHAASPRNHDALAELVRRRRAGRITTGSFKVLVRTLARNDEVLEIH